MIVDTFEELKLQGDLPSPAGVGMRILELTRTQDYSTDDIGSAIRADSALTGRILKLANSSLHGGLEPATSVSEAIMRLGSGSVRDLALAFSLVADARSGTCDAFDYSKYWSKSLARAVVAQALSERLRIGKGEEAYLCALLGEVGRLALASVYAQSYGELLRANFPHQRPEDLLPLEFEKFNIDHSQIAACLLQEWGLPDTFIEAVQAFTQSRSISRREEQVTDLVGILRYADLIAEVFVSHPVLEATTWSLVDKGFEQLQHVLSASDEEFALFINGCVNSWTQWGENLGINTQKETNHLLIRGLIEDARNGKLPEKQPAPLAVEPPTAASADVDVSGKDVRVLAIDDDPTTLRVLVKHLEQKGYEVLTAPDGRQGLRIALERLPDIVIADWEMPELDGVELCKSLRQTAPGRKMYFLLLTGRAEEERIVEAFDNGVDDYVTKPFIPRILAARIKGGLRLARLQRKIEADRQTMMQQVAELGMLTRKLRSAALTDPLTELPNRRYGIKRLENEWASMRRTGRPLSVIMVDIDNFKNINDTLGHDLGDSVLCEAGQIIRSCLRQSDEVCRLGGEEFVVICKNTSQEDCGHAAERIRKAVDEHVFEGYDVPGKVTVSLGVVATTGDRDTKELLKASDEAMYEAKRSGRNCVRQAPGPKAAGEIRKNA